MGLQWVRCRGGGGVRQKVGSPDALARCNTYLDPKRSDQNQTQNQTQNRDGLVSDADADSARPGQQLCPARLPMEHPGSRGWPYSMKSRRAAFVEGRTAGRLALIIQF